MTFLNTLLLLSPFLVSSAYFFLEYVEKETAYPHYTIFKILPTASLCLFVLALNSNSKYSSRIFLGLLMSTLGDAALCYPNLAGLGMALFALAQITYISAFGFRNKRHDLGLLILCVYAAACFYLHSYLIRVDVSLGYGAEVYLALLFTMIWRACARFGFLNLDSFWALCGSLGPICFGISDVVLFYHLSVAPVQNGNFIIMSTYYAAQVGIALTTLKTKFY